MVTTRVGIASQFLQNAYTNGEQAARSLDELARNALFNCYFGGNTRVRVTLGSAGPTISVDDVRGFQFVPILTGAGFTSASQALSAGQPSPTMAPVSGTNTLAVVVGSNSYTLTGASVDGTNVSTTPGGISRHADLLGQRDRRRRHARQRGGIGEGERDPAPVRPALAPTSSPPPTRSP